MSSIRWLTAGTLIVWFSSALCAQSEFGFINTKPSGQPYGFEGVEYNA